MEESAEMVLWRLERSRRSLHAWVDSVRAEAESRLALPAGHPDVLQDEGYLRAVAAWSAWNRVSEDMFRLLIRDVCPGTAESTETALPPGEAAVQETRDEHAP